MNTPENAILINPRHPEGARLVRAAAGATELRGHVFLLTSGTTRQSGDDYRWVALSKEAILVSAEAVNRHIASDSKDIWFNCLPEFHIGGLSIWARAHLSGAKVVGTQEGWKWDTRRFVDALAENRATLTSLVPTQVFDLVRAGVRAPGSLRAAFVGGGALSEGLLQQALALGWACLPTYGMSEASSQVATAASGADRKTELKILPHLEAKTMEDGRLALRGASLFQGYVRVMLSTSGESIRFEDPKVDGWFVTGDFGTAESGILAMSGRVKDRIKIGGELVDLGGLQKILEEVSRTQAFASNVAVYAASDDRLERVIHLACTPKIPERELEELVRRFNSRVLPFERIRGVKRVSEIPRTELGKVVIPELT